MSQPVYFLVVSWHGREHCSLVYDDLPRWVTGKRARDQGLLYVLRLDTLPAGERWGSASLSQLVARYKLLRAQGKLPASNLAQRRSSEAA